MSARPSVVSQALARDRLGVPSVIMFALTAAAPLMVVGALVSTGWGVVGTTGFPLAFLIIAVILALFSFGYVAMSRHITNAGAFYSYIAQGLGRPLGVGGAMVALLAYNLLQVGLYGAFGGLLSQFLAEKADLNIDWWVIAIVLWLFIAVLGLLRVDVNSKVLMILLGAELIVVTVFDVIFFSHPAGGSLSVEPWTWGALKDTAGPAFAVATTAFVGFEAAPVFAEEARSKNRTVAVATFVGLGVMLLSYSLTSWAASASMGVGETVGKAQETLDQGGPFFPALAEASGSWASDLGRRTELPQHDGPVRLRAGPGAGAPVVLRPHPGPFRRPDGRLAVPDDHRRRGHRAVRGGRLGPAGQPVLLAGHRGRRRRAAAGRRDVPGGDLLLHPRRPG
jgi:amino acid transporter